MLQYWFLIKIIHHHSTESQYNLKQKLSVVSVNQPGRKPPSLLRSAIRSLSLTTSFTHTVFRTQKINKITKVNSKIIHSIDWTLSIVVQEEEISLDRRNTEECFIFQSSFNCLITLKQQSNYLEICLHFIQLSLKFPFLVTLREDSCHTSLLGRQETADQLRNYR